MPISPNDVERIAIEMRKVYTEAELQILKMIADRAQKGIDDDGWLQRQLVQVRSQANDVDKIVRKLVDEYEQRFAAGIMAAYQEGCDEATNEAEDLGLDVPDDSSSKSNQKSPGMDKRKSDGSSKNKDKMPKVTVNTENLADNFGLINNHAMFNLVSTGTGLLKNAHFQILRSAKDAYRQIAYEAVSLTTAGTHSYRQAAQVALNKLADRGITTFIDAKGRSWDMGSYVEMAVRTGTAQAAISGHIDRVQSLGHDLVIVSDSPEECPICRPWEGKILSISGKDPNYPGVATARAQGLWHANCTHTVGIWIQGLSQPMALNQDPRLYEQRQKQRSMERQIRKWKRRLAVAITPEEKAKAEAKVKEWQEALSEFTKATDRRRDYWRETPR